MNIRELIDTTRLLIGADESVGSGAFGDEDLVKFVDHSLNLLWAHQVDVCPNFYLETATTTELGMTFTQVATGQYRARLPRYIYQVVRIDAESTTDYNGRLPHLGFQASGETRPFRASVTAPCGWFVAANNTVYFQGVDRAPGTYRVWYVRRQPGMVMLTAVSGSTTAFTATIGTSETLGNLKANADWYIGSRFEITSAGNAIPQGEEAFVTDYSVGASYPTATFTVETLSAAIGVGDTLAMIPMLDEASHELVCYLAAIRAMDRLGNDRWKAILSTTASDLWEKWIALARRTQLQEEATMLYAG